MTAAPQEPVGDREGWDLSTAVVLFHDALGARLGVGATDHKALGLLRRNGPMTLSAIAAGLGVVAGAATAVVDRLEAAGLVERFRDPGDRRRVLVRPLSDAAPAERDAYARLGGETAAFMAGLGEDERRAVLDYIALTRRLLEEETARLRDADA
ncbi:MULTISPECIES: MarR family transcriptional regulator [unclassified Nocardiopsis]|uniref:MarR family transcriptional regulator n=1 Tax=Nocardiopsis TaxID=2013 RepID=UPI00387AF3D4